MVHELFPMRTEGTSGSRRVASFSGTHSRLVYFHDRVWRLTLSLIGYYFRKHVRKRPHRFVDCSGCHLKQFLIGQAFAFSVFQKSDHRLVQENPYMISPLSLREAIRLHTNPKPS